MQRNIDTTERVDELSHAITHLMVEGGIPAVTMRAVADQVGLSTGTLNKHLGGRTRLLGLASGMFYRRLAGDVVSRRSTDGIIALLPADADDTTWVRAWLAWSELARDEELVGYRSVESDDFERGYVARWLAAPDADDPSLAPADPPPDPAQLSADLLLAVAHGLRHAVARREEPMSVERAQALLLEAARRIRTADRAAASPAGTPAPGPHPPADGAR